jgi:hypothetical protein
MKKRVVSQSRTHSLIEALVNVAIGYGIAVAAQIIVFPIFGVHISLRQNIWTMRSSGQLNTCANSLPIPSDGICVLGSRPVFDSSEVLFMIGKLTDERCLVPIFCSPMRCIH